MPVSKHKIDHLNTEITAAFLDVYEGANDDSIVNEIALTIPMKTRKMEVPVRGFIGQMREWIGPRIIDQASYDRFEFTISKFEKTLGILRDDVEDDNIRIYKPGAQALGLAAKEWKAVQIFKQLETNSNGIDGVPLFSTAHPAENGVNQSNYQTGASPGWYLFDTSRPYKPLIFGERIAPELQPPESNTSQHTFFNDEYIWGLRARGGAANGLWQLAYKSKAALTDVNLESALQEMSSRANDRGDKLGIKGTLLVVPGSLQGDARRLLDRAVNAGTDNIYKGAVRWVVGDRLTGV